MSGPPLEESEGPQNGCSEPDEVVEEVREVHRRISARFDHDLRKYGEYLGEYQKKFGDRLILPPSRNRAEPPPSDE